MKHIAIAAVLLLSACGGGSEEEAGNNSSSSVGAAVEQTPSNLQDDPNNSVVPLSPPSPQPAPSGTPVAALPADFQGRWGMGDKDCDPAFDYVAKGLMVVSADTLKFYESRGRVERARSDRPGAIELDLAFAGEGQDWQRTETLTLQDGGRTLVREEQKPAGSYRYTRCPAGKDQTA
jgi:hypothetical protein